MAQICAFMKKESLEYIRTGKLLIFMVLSILFGIMNPAIAKLMPWLIEVMSDNLDSTGLTIHAIDITAQTSWIQFYKNIPILLLFFLLLISNTLTAEYQKGTLVNILTNGLKRPHLLFSKMLTLIGLWTLGYWICYGITYGYNAYFWDNHIIPHIGLAAFCFYLGGIWLISLILLLSSIFQTNSMVLITTLILFVSSYLLGLVPVVKSYLPTYLFKASDLLTEGTNTTLYLSAIGITIGYSIINILISMLYFNRRSL